MVLLASTGQSPQHTHARQHTHKRTIVCALSHAHTCSHRSGAFALVDVSTGETKHTFREGGEPEALALSPDGRLLASANDDGNVTLRSTQLCQEEVHQLVGCSGSCMELSISVGGQPLLAVCRDDESIALINVAKGRLEQVKASP